MNKLRFTSVLIIAALIVTACGSDFATDEMEPEVSRVKTRAKKKVGAGGEAEPTLGPNERIYFFQGNKNLIVNHFRFPVSWDGGYDDEIGNDNLHTGNITYTGINRDIRNIHHLRTYWAGRRFCYAETPISINFEYDEIKKVEVLDEISYVCVHKNETFTGYIQLEYNIIDTE